MNPKIPEHYLEFALKLACIVLVLNLCMPSMGVAASPPASGMGAKTLINPDADPDNDPDQAPAIFEQWRSGSSTRGSLDEILANLVEDKENKVQHLHTEFPGGARESRETIVMSKLPDHRLLYDSKEIWATTGKLKSSFHQVDTLDEKGVQITGRRRTLNYKRGMLVAEILEEWKPTFRGWLVTYSSAISYFDDGAMQQRVTELPPANRKKKETWALQASLTG